MNRKASLSRQSACTESGSFVQHSFTGRSKTDPPYLKATDEYPHR